MIDQIIIPDVDPIPLPAPIWLLKFLLLLTFGLHIAAMNFALGGGLIAAVTEYLGRRKNNQYYFDLSRSLAKMLPAVTATTITLGVAPLLFVQVLYGQFFYTSTILIAGPWLAIIILLMIAYYGYYFYSFRWEKIKKFRMWVVFISAVLLAVIGLIYSNNIILMLTPDKWKGMYFTNPHGLHLNFSDATIIPRYLHFMIAAPAVAGILVIFWGHNKIKVDVELGRWAVRYGASWFIILTFINILIGVLFLITLPGDFMLLFLGRDIIATVYLMIAVLSIIICIGLMFAAMRSLKPRIKIYSATLFLLITLVFMVLIRHELREAYLKPYLAWDNMKVEPQWTIIVIFAVLLVGGLLAIVWMLKKAFGKSKLQET